MIGRLRKDVVPSVRRTRYDITHFRGVDADTPEDSLSINYCSYGYNIRLYGGELSQSFGVGEAEYTACGNEVALPRLDTQGQKILKMHHYLRYDRDTGDTCDELIVYGTLHHYFRCSLTETGGFTYFNAVFNESDETDFINYYMDDKDCCLIFMGSGGLCIYDGSDAYKQYPDVPGMSSVCMHYDRVFGVSTAEPDTIYFSAPLKPYEFAPDAGGGSISLMDAGGKILKIVSFKNYIYIFREYSVYRLTAYVDPTEYSLSRIFSAKDKIRTDTVASDYSMMVFVAGNEMYSFDGYEVKKFFPKVVPLVADASRAAGCIFGNRYYLAAVMKKEGDEQVGDESPQGLGIVVNNAIFAFDLYSEGIDIVRGADVIGFTGVTNSEMQKLFVRFGNNRGSHVGMINDSGKLFSLPLAKHWRSPKSNLGEIVDAKILRRLYLTSAYDVNLTVIADDEAYTRKMRGSVRATGTSFNAIGDGFALQIDAVGDKLSVTEIQMLIDVNRRYNAD